MATLSLIISGETAPSRTFVDAAVDTSTEVITIPGHNLQNGDVVRFTNSGGGLPTGLTSNHPYYVISRTEGTFKVSATSGGSAVNISAASGGGTHTVTLQESRFDDLLADCRGDARQAALALSKHLDAMANGARRGTILAHTAAADAAAASAVITCAAVDADDTVTIADIVLTAKASPSGEAQFDQSGSNTADGASLASVINAHSVLGRLLTASNASGAVTITCKVKGQIGNLITVATSNGTRLAITGSATALTGGTGGPQGAATSYSLV